MYIEHIALQVDDLENMRKFYENVFMGKTYQKKYINIDTEQEIYFLDFQSGSRLELMKIKNSPIIKNRNNHFTFACKDEVELNLLFSKISEFEGEIIEKPRLSGLGDLVGKVLDPEGNMLEILIKPNLICTSSGDQSE